MTEAPTVRIRLAVTGDHKRVAVYDGTRHVVAQMPGSASWEDVEAEALRKFAE